MTKSNGCYLLNGKWDGNAACIMKLLACDGMIEEQGYNPEF